MKKFLILIGLVVLIVAVREVKTDKLITTGDAEIGGAATIDGTLRVNAPGSELVNDSGQATQVIQGSLDAKTIYEADLDGGSGGPRRWDIITDDVTGIFYFAENGTTSRLTLEEGGDVHVPFNLRVGASADTAIPADIWTSDSVIRPEYSILYHHGSFNTAWNYNWYRTNTTPSYKTLGASGGGAQGIHMDDVGIIFYSESGWTDSSTAPLERMRIDDDQIRVSAALQGRASTFTESVNNGNNSSTIVDLAAGQMALVMCNQTTATFSATVWCAGICASTPSGVENCSNFAADSGNECSIIGGPIRVNNSSGGTETFACQYVRLL